MQQYAVETFNLIKRFGNYTAVDGLNLRTEKGAIHSLLGQMELRKVLPRNQNPEQPTSTGK